VLSDDAKVTRVRTEPGLPGAAAAEAAVGDVENADGLEEREDEERIIQVQTGRNKRGPPTRVENRSKSAR